MTTTETRICRKCGGDKPLGAFAYYGGMSRKRRDVCRDCRTEQYTAASAKGRARKALTQDTSATVCGGRLEASTINGSRCCGIRLYVGGTLDNDLADAVAHGHATLCCGCKGCFAVGKDEGGA